MLYLVAQTTPDISTETKFLQYAIPVLISVIGVLFYLLRDSYLARLADKEAYVQQIIAIKTKDVELITGLKVSLDASNNMTEQLIRILGDSKDEDFKKRLQDLQNNSKNNQTKAVN